MNDNPEILEIEMSKEWDHFGLRAKRRSDNKWLWFHWDDDLSIFDHTDLILFPKNARTVNNNLWKSWQDKKRQIDSIQLAALCCGKEWDKWIDPETIELFTCTEKITFVETPIKKD